MPTKQIDATENKLGDSLGVEELAKLLHASQGEVLRKLGSDKQVPWKDMSEDRRENYRTRARYILGDHVVIELSDDVRL